jgi:hypothetical protein
MARSEHIYKEPKDGLEKVWIPEEYEAGYGARFQGVSECRTATRCWLAGWQEADREIGTAVLSEGVPWNTEPTAPWSLFGTGRQARACELPFDQFSPDDWKKSWVEADIAMSLESGGGDVCRRAQLHVPRREDRRAGPPWV